MVYPQIWKVAVIALMMGGIHLHAQEFGIEYTAELQTDYKDCNFVNLLYIGGQVPLSRSVSLDASTISIAKTHDCLIGDLQTFSNIEEENLALGIAMCGITWNVGDEHLLFFGVRNMNEDYFTSETTSLFANSSCGIYPTISANYPIANYPLSSVGVHYKYSTEKIGIQASIYNGAGYNGFYGKGNVFRFDPKTDGVSCVADLQYKHNGNSYFIGNALYCNKATGYSPWVYAEQSVGYRLTLLAGYSHAFASDAECKDFAGLGLDYRTERYELGMFSDYAHFSHIKEWATELTCKYVFNEHVYLQPSAHFILTGKQYNNVLCLRLGLTY